jgi:hypothetical protein
MRAPDVCFQANQPRAWDPTYHGVVEFLGAAAMFVLAVLILGWRDYRRAQCRACGRKHAFGPDRRAHACIYCGGRRGDYD